MFHIIYQMRYTCQRKVVLDLVFLSVGGCVTQQSSRLILKKQLITHSHGQHSVNSVVIRIFVFIFSMLITFGIKNSSKYFSRLWFTFWMRSLRLKGPKFAWSSWTPTFFILYVYPVKLNTEKTYIIRFMHLRKEVILVKYKSWSTIIDIIAASPAAYEHKTIT